MGVLGTRLDPASDAYRANRAANLEALEELDRLLAVATGRLGDRLPGRGQRRHRHRARGRGGVRSHGQRDPTVRGGATNPLGLKKTLRAMEIAERNRLPLVQLIDGPAVAGRHPHPGPGVRQLHA
jgi:acyl-CoA carboxylase subunit beta